MRIYKMTATFGKLEHAELELQPGLNIIEAPNEWGKSTWCAFLLAMLYGLDTRAKTTKTALADKERYAPWSRKPMAGRIDLHWKGRDITIERSTKGRVPMGVFRAYETASGLDIPELTAANCGVTLLGVEQSVFRRAGFIRQSDMPVTQDEALRRRLNDLVTTGDETGDGDRLAKELKELKNKCRYNRTGLLPQAEAEENRLEEKIAEWDSVEAQSRTLKQRIGEEKNWLRALENHKAALECAAAEADAVRVAEARDNRDKAEAAFAAVEGACAELPSREEAQQKVQEITQLQIRWDALQEQLQQLPQPTDPPQPPAPFRENGGEGQEAVLEADIRQYGQLCSRGWMLFLLLAGAALGSGIFLAVIRQWLFAGVCLGLAVLLTALSLWKRSGQNRKKRALEEKYGSSDPAQWRKDFADYRENLSEFERANRQRREKKIQLEAQRETLENQRRSLCGDRSFQWALESWQQAVQRWDQYAAARKELLHAERYLTALQAMAKTAAPPAMEDTLAYSMDDTIRMMADSRAEHQRLLNRLGQYQGRMEALGDRDALCLRLQTVQQRMEKLEKLYRAASLGLETLAKARQELQRRFAPRISKRAQELLGQMTGGRYDRLSLSEDLTLLAGAEQEDTLHEAIWRSDGTVDQLYFALRLAVAEELTAKAPLILDDAFVRFDDVRLKAALDILKQEAEEKQVLLFTCQHREKELL